MLQRTDQAYKVVLTQLQARPLLHDYFLHLIAYSCTWDKVAILIDAGLQSGTYIPLAHHLGESWQF